MNPGDVVTFEDLEGVVISIIGDTVNVRVNTGGIVSLELAKVSPVVASAQEAEDSNA